MKTPAARAAPGAAASGPRVGGVRQPVPGYGSGGPRESRCCFGRLLRRVLDGHLVARWREGLRRHRDGDFEHPVGECALDLCPVHAFRKRNRAIKRSVRPFRGVPALPLLPGLTLPLAGDRQVAVDDLNLDVFFGEAGKVQPHDKAIIPLEHLEVRRPREFVVLAPARTEERQTALVEEAIEVTEHLTHPCPRLHCHELFVPHGYLLRAGRPSRPVIPRSTRRAPTARAADAAKESGGPSMYWAAGSPQRRADHERATAVPREKRETVATNDRRAGERHGLPRRFPRRPRTISRWSREESSFRASRGDPSWYFLCGRSGGGHDDRDHQTYSRAGRLRPGVPGRPASRQDAGDAVGRQPP